MVQQYECMFSSDLSRKRKRWVDGLLALNTQSRHVRIDYADKPETSPRAPYSGVIDTGNLQGLLDEEEVRLGSVMVQLGSLVSGIPGLSTGTGGALRKGPPTKLAPAPALAAQPGPARSRPRLGPSPANGLVRGLCAPFRSPELLSGAASAMDKTRSAPAESLIVLPAAPVP